MRKKRTMVDMPRPAVNVRPDEKLAQVICFSIYSKGCVCRDRGFGEACKNMLDAAHNARAQIAKESAS